MDGPVLGLDYGTRRIGLAVSDAEGAIAFPIGALESRGRARDLEALGALARERAVCRIVVGLPLHLDGRVSEIAEAARRFAEALGEATGLPVELLDERWTSVEAERALADAPGARARRRRSPREAKGQVDSVAAALILRTYLERARGALAR